MLSVVLLGNYEEGFGMEKHSKQWQTTEQTTIENSGKKGREKQTRHVINTFTVINLFR